MGFLDSLFNPLWRRVKRLPESARFDVFTVLSLHGFLRSTMQERVLTPFKKLCEMPSSPVCRFFKVQPCFTPKLESRLIDEAVLALLCCCRRSGLPVNTRSKLDLGKLPEEVGALALAEINYRLGRTGPATLEKTGYSTDPEEARTQLLLVWMKLLEIEDARFVGIVGEAFFAEAWTDCAEILLSGYLQGLAGARALDLRNDPARMQERVRQECASLSPGGRAVVEYMISKLLAGEKSATAESSKVPINREETLPPAPHVVGGARSCDKGKFAGKVRRDPDGSNVIQVGPNASFDLCTSLFALLSDNLKDEDRVIFARWTGLSPSPWTDQHRETFVLALTHHFHDLKKRGVAVPNALKGAVEQIIATFPPNMLPPLDRPLTNEVRDMFNRMFGI